VALTLREGTTVGNHQTLRCLFCHWMRLQSYQINFKPYERGGFLFPRQPLYSCSRCLPHFKNDPRLAQITKLLSASEIANSTNRTATQIYHLWSFGNRTTKNLSGEAASQLTARK
jgi:hypothetical protein